MIKIDKDVPVPRNAGLGARNKYPWVEMKPGHSFFVPGMSLRPTDGFRVMNVQAGRKAHPGSTWACRTVTENGVAGVRVWRLS